MSIRGCLILILQLQNVFILVFALFSSLFEGGHAELLRERKAYDLETLRSLFFQFVFKLRTVLVV